MTRRNWVDGSIKPKKSKWWDLCVLDTGRKKLKGWWNGFTWEGLHYDGEPVKRWKFYDFPRHEH